MAKRVPLGTRVDIGEEGGCLDIAVLIESIVHVRHVDIALMNSLALDATEMDGLLLRVVLQNTDNRETVHDEEVFIRSIPDGASSRGRVVQVHRALAILVKT